MSAPVDWLVTELNVLGGAETYVRRTAPLLRQRGWDIRVITLVSGGAYVQDLRREGVPVIELGLRGRLDLIIPVIRLLRLWRQSPPSLLHTHLYHAGILGRLMAGWLGIHPVIAHQHGAELARRSWRTWVDRASQAQVARYVVTCNAVGAILARREQIPAAKITTIYNGLALPAASQPVPPDWPFPPGPPVLITIGRLSPEKDHAALLNACAALNRQGLAWRLLVLGEGRQRQALEQLSADLGLQAQVYWAGNQSPVFPWLAHADIFVLPSRWEGVSMALLEAMACGLPVVATAVGGTPEVVLEGQTGLLAPPGDSDALAQALAALLRDPSRRHTLGAAGRARLAEEFSIDRTLERLEDLYRRLLSAKETPDG